MILDHIARARALGLPHVYLGYWVEGSRKMAYKAAYLPQERLGLNGWVRVERERAGARVERRRSALDEVHRQPAERRLLVFRLHVGAGLTHGRDDAVERHLVAAVAAQAPAKRRRSP